MCWSVNQKSSTSPCPQKQHSRYSMRWKDILPIVALAIAPTRAIFSDEAFTIDFHHALLGIPQPHSTFFHKPDPASNAALLYSLSDKAILGAINPRDGSVVWRQSIAGVPLENATESFVVAGETDGKIVAAVGDRLTAWDAAHGRLAWSHKLGLDSKIVGLQPVPVLGGSTDGAVQDIIILSQSQKAGTGHTVSRIGGDGSSMRWQYSDPDNKNDANVYVSATPTHVFVVTRSAGLISGQKTKVQTLDVNTGKLLKDQSLSLDAESVSFDGQLVSAACSGAPFLVTSETPYKSLKLNMLGNSKVSTINLEDKTDTITSLKVHAACGAKAAPHFLVHVQTGIKNWAEVYQIDIVSGDATKVYSLPGSQEKSSFAASSNADKVFFTRVTSTQIISYSSDSRAELGRWTRNEIGTALTSSSDPVFATAEVAARDGTSVAVRVAVVSPEGSWYLIRNGDTQWSRPEVLAHATLAAWFDDIKTDRLVQEVQSEISVDPATAYINRLYRHTQELVHLPAYLMQLPQSLLNPSSERAVIREDLTGSKSLLVATKDNRLFSLNGLTGKVQWNADLSSTITSGSLIRSLTSEQGRATLYTSDGSVTVVNASSGALIEHKSGSIPVAKLIELPGSPASTILKINEDGKPEFASDLAPSVPDEGNAIITLNKAGTVTGWTVGTTIREVWTFSPSTGRIIDVTSRSAHDPVASIGKVLGDRSVLYKYISPNLVLLTTLTPTGMSVYLLDAVTGTVLHTLDHAGVLTSFPISSVMSENWFAYTFTSANPETKAVTTQIIISELYESSVSNDRGSLPTKANYSSFGPDANARPHVESAAFTLTEPISDLSVTQTAQGITSRQLLAYLPSTHAIATIPLHLLNARRPLDRDATAQEAEEGLFRYNPQLDLDPKLFLSHSRDVMGVQQILTAPTLLESTSLVFAYGHDIFGTQIAPSQTFDVLGKSFKRIQLLATVVALYLGVLALRPLVRRNVVKRGWQ